MGGGYAWVTLATNDSYSLGALVLAHSLKQVGTKQSLVVLVTPGVTGSMRSKLSSVFDIVHDVNILDSKDESNLRLLKRPELGVTFTKLHCWRLTQFEKCVFLDADTLVLQNCDELFDREELSAAPDIGWPDCFNSGVFVYRPSNETYEKLVQFALEKGSFDGGDQGLLNLYFSDWSYKDISKHLPFIYNMSSTATYSYLPAFKQFGGDAKIIHFIAGTKPWLQYFNTETKQVQAPNDLRHLTSVLQHWWNIFCNCVHSNLTPDMARSTTDNSPSTINNPNSQPDYNKHYDDSNIEYYDPWDDYDKKILNPSTSIQHNQQEPFEKQPIESHNTNVSSYQAVHNVINPFSHNHQYQPEISREHNYTHISHNHHHHHHPVENLPQHHHHQFENSSEHNQHHNPIENPPETHHHHDNHPENLQQHHHHHHEIHHYTPETFHSHDHNAHKHEYHQFHESSFDNHNHHDSNTHRSLPLQHSPYPQPTQINTYDNSSQNLNSYTTNSNPESNWTAPPVVVETFPKHNEPTFVALPKECETTNINETKLQKHKEKNDSGLAGAFAQLTLGVARTAEQIALDDHLRRQGWEIGNIDYLGRDSFDNIWSKICETLASGPALPQPKEPSPPKTEVIQSSGTVVPAKETPTQVKPTEVQTPLQTQTDKTETETPPSPKTDAPTESPAQQGTPLPEPPKQSGEIIQTATKPDTPTPITPDTTAPTKPIDTITATSPGPTSEIPIPQQSKIEEKTEKLETESDKATSNIETVAQKPEEPKSLPTEILNKSETEVPPKTEAPIPKTEVPIEAKAAAKTETPVTSVQPPESKTETTTTVADKPETIATSIETMELTQTKPETQLATPTDIQAAKSEATTTVQLEAPTKDKPPESPKTEPASTTQSSPATAPEELVCTKSAEEKQTPAVAKTEEQKQPPSATTTEGPACPKPTDLACVKPVEQKQSPTPSATATATSPKPEELVCAKPTEQKQAPISPATEFKPSPKPTEQKQPPATVPAPAEQKQPPAPVPAPAEQKQSPAPVPAPAEQKQSPAPVPAPAEQKQSPASVPAPAEQKQSPAPVPAPTEQKQPPVPASATTESTACSKPEKVEEPKAHATAEPVTEKPAKLDTTKVEPKPKEEKKATETLSDPQPKVKEGTEPAQSKGGDGSTGSTPTPPPRKGSSGTKKTKSKK